MIRKGTPNRSRLLTKTALSVALATGMVVSAGLASSPAHAQKKKKNDDGGRDFSKAFVAAAPAAQEAINAADPANPASVSAAKAALEQTYASVETADDRYSVGTLAVNLGGKISDASLQRRGLKDMLASGRAPAEEVGKYNSLVGQLAYQAKDYPEAIQYMEAGRSAGYADENTYALLAESYIASNQQAKGIALLKSAITEMEKTDGRAPEAWYRRGIASAYQAGMKQDAADFGAMLIAKYPEPKNVGMAATVVRELGGFGSQETLDVMRLIGRTNSYAEARDYVEYIEAADPRRLPGEVITVIDAGLASGKLKASDVFVTDAKSQAQGRLSADRSGLDAYIADASKGGATEATVSGAADAALSYGRFAEAATLYAAALEKAGVDRNRALTRLGIALYDAGRYAEANEAFAQVTGTRAPIARLWSAYATSKTAPASPATASAQ